MSYWSSLFDVISLRPMSVQWPLGCSGVSEPAVHLALALLKKFAAERRPTVMLESEV